MGHFVPPPEHCHNLDCYCADDVEQSRGFLEREHRKDKVILQRIPILFAAIFVGYSGFSTAHAAETATSQTTPHPVVGKASYYARHFTGKKTASGAYQFLVTKAGEPVRLSVHSNAYGKVLFGITLTAAAVLAALAGRRLWHRFRGQPDRADLDRPDPPDARRADGVDRRVDEKNRV